MYSSDDCDSYLDDSDRKCRKTKSKTTLPPPVVSSFEELQAFKTKLSETIICAIDFETVDNHHGTELDKMSEIGIAVFDPRKTMTETPRKITSIIYTPNSCISNGVLEGIAKSTTAIHLIKAEWKNETEVTCKAFWHRKKPHSARPYHSKFARSTILTSAQCIKNLKTILRELAIQNLTTEEEKNGQQRQVRVLFWDSGLEERIFRQANIRLSELGQDIGSWDLQAWWPFKARFSDGKNRGLARGKVAFESLGVLGSANETILHNATNDAIAQLLAFQRMMTISEAEWDRWFSDMVGCEPISFGWVDPAIYQSNINRAPVKQKRYQPRRHRAPESHWRDKHRRGVHIQASEPRGNGTSGQPSTQAATILTNSSFRTSQSQPKATPAEQEPASDAPPSTYSITGIPTDIDGHPQTFAPLSSA